MKITNSSIETLGGASAANVTGSASEGTSNSATRTGGQADSINLSNAGLLLNLAKTSAPPANAAKLANVAMLVRSGQYQADTESVSQALVQGHLQ